MGDVADTPMSDEEQAFAENERLRAERDEARELARRFMLERNAAHDGIREALNHLDLLKGSNPSANAAVAKLRTVMR